MSLSSMAARPFGCVHNTAPTFLNLDILNRSSGCRKTGWGWRRKSFPSDALVSRGCGNFYLSDREASVSHHGVDKSQTASKYIPP